MPHRLRSFVIAGSLVALTAGATACSSSGDGGSAASTTRPAPQATTSTSAAETTTTDAATSTTSTTAASGSTTTTSPTATELPPCQILLEEYSTVFVPDDLSGTVIFFRKYAPFMPADVKAAVLRIADAYDEADKLDNLNFSDVDLTADAQTFSDWTNDGCPAG